jgi:hypothetical protein
MPSGCRACVGASHHNGGAEGLGQSKLHPCRSILELIISKDCGREANHLLPGEA